MFNFSKETPALSPQDVAEKLAENNVGFIDVRTEEEYKSGHAKNAQNIPLDTLEGREDELKGFDTVYVICRSGGRSDQAVLYLRSQGINAINVSGGTIIWKLVGLAME